MGAGRKRKWRGTPLVRNNVRRISDDELAAAQPHRAWLPADRRMDAKAATALGGLNIVGAITNSQYEAGQRYLVIVAEYRASIGAPMEGFSTSAKTSRCVGAKNCDPCDCRTRRDRHTRAFAALSEAGAIAARSVAHTIQGERCPTDEIPHLRRGLQALARHFGLAVDNSAKISA